MRITVNTTIGELLDLDPEMKDVLAGMGMHCSTCAVGRRETPLFIGKRITCGARAIIVSSLIIG